MYKKLKRYDINKRNRFNSCHQFSNTNISKEIYKNIISPILDHLDSETWHDNARELLHLAEISPITLKILEQFTFERKRFSNQKLEVSIGNIKFENPLIVGAGWDKAGKSVMALYTLGFSAVEVGSVTAYPQPGNPKPRQFMIGPGVALNRLGFNSPGMNAVAKNLDRYKECGIPIGISIGKNKDTTESDAPEAHAKVARKLYKYASYFTLNVSSPNTPELRKLQGKKLLTDNVQAINEVMIEKGEIKPTFVKIAPDLTNEEVDDVIRVVIDNKLTGIIAVNTTVRPDLKAKYGEKWRNEPGGLSGKDPEFRKMATEKVAHIYRETNGEIIIIGVGGCFDTSSTLEKIMAGATLVEFVTGIRSEGPTLPGKINHGLVEFMKQEGLISLDEIIGIDVRK